MSAIRRRFVRGREHPRGVVWFGLSSFWGHLRHFAASAIATEDVDSRDWMHADEPPALSARIGRALGASRTASTLTESLGRDLWVDYLADTGDDVSVSRAVAGLVFQPYELPDPDRPGQWLRAPRGDVLFFGGDTAYPVATADEVLNRVVAPFNQILKERLDGQRRVLIGIPGNHDWYDGLDGFGRMFRRHLITGESNRGRATTRGRAKTRIGTYAVFAKEFVLGGSVDKPKTLELLDYVPVQNASYFALPLAPGITVLAVDRQLKAVDARQRFYFASWLNQNLAVSPWVVLPDPVYPFGRPSPTGTASIEALGLTLSARPHFVLSGDIHHYRREVEGPTLHVTAGGGGAFLHPAPLGKHKGREAILHWPGARQSQSLLWQVPWKVAAGRSGFLPHLAFLLLFFPIMMAEASFSETRGVMVAGPIVIALVLTGIYSLIGGVRRGHPVTVVFAFLAGLLSAGIPVFAARGVDLALSAVGVSSTLWVTFGAILLAGAFVGALVFGAYLALLTWLGFENTQAFTALDHPGFKHFVRLRVRADGSAIDGWVVGLVDPLAPDAQPVLVDSFTWKARR